MNATGRPGFDEYRPIMLVAAPWQARTYILAELQEQGYEVRSLPGIRHALGYLVRRPRVHPALIVLDTMGDPDLNARTAHDLFAITAPAHWVVIASAVRENLPEDIITSSRVHVLRRPLAVEDVVNTIVSVVQQVSDETLSPH